MLNFCPEPVILRGNMLSVIVSFGSIMLMKLRGLTTAASTICFAVTGPLAAASPPAPLHNHSGGNSHHNTHYLLGQRWRRQDKTP